MLAVAKSDSGFATGGCDNPEQRKLEQYELEQYELEQRKPERGGSGGGLGGDL
jgi:hypothetical protein